MTPQARKEYCENNDLCFISLRPLDINDSKCVWHYSVGDIVFVNLQFHNDKLQLEFMEQEKKKMQSAMPLLHHITGGSLGFDELNDFVNRTMNPSIDLQKEKMNS